MNNGMYTGGTVRLQSGNDRHLHNNFSVGCIGNLTESHKLIK